MTFRKIWIVDCIAAVLFATGIYNIVDVIVAVNAKQSLIEVDEIKLAPIMFGFWFVIRLFLILSKSTDRDLFRIKKWNITLFVIAIPFVLSHRITSIVLGTYVETAGYVQCKDDDRFSRLRNIDYVFDEQGCPKN